MELDRRLSSGLGEQVRRELRQRGEEEQWRREEQAGERQGELQQIRQVATLRHRLEQSDGIGKRLLDDARR